MTELTRTEEAREAIARFHFDVYHSSSWDTASEITRVNWRRWADALLSLTDPTGKPYLAVVSADQTIPTTVFNSRNAPFKAEGYAKCSADMLAAGFVKVENRP